MPDVSILVNGRTYRVACGPGEETRLQTLAADLDGRVSDLARRFGQVGEGYLLVVASLMMADELDELRKSAADQPDPEQIDIAANAVELLAERIEALAERLERP